MICVNLRIDLSTSVSHEEERRFGSRSEIFDCDKQRSDGSGSGFRVDRGVHDLPNMLRKKIYYSSLGCRDNLHAPFLIKLPSNWPSPHRRIVVSGVAH